MEQKLDSDTSLLESLKAYLDRRSITMLFLGFSAGLPILLIFSSLSLWLREAGVARSAVTYFSWAALGYSFKFVWAPLVDKLPLPILGRLGRRRSWLLVSQLMIIGAISWMALVDPAVEGSLVYMACAAVLLGFSSATQDIVIDAYRIESADTKMQAILAATYIGGYRLGMIVAGAGSLFIASYFGTTKEMYSYDAWMKTYLVMAAFMLIGVVTTVLRPEPKVDTNNVDRSTKEYATFFCLFLVIVSVFVSVFTLSTPIANELKISLTDLLSNKAFASFITGTLKLSVSIFAAIATAFIINKSNLVNTDMVNQGYIDPVKNFFERYGKRLAILLLLLVGFYRVSDIVLGVISNVFYQDLGFSKNQIASVVKTFGVVMSLLGGFLGGALTNKLGVMRMLWWGAVLAALTNLLFLLLAKTGSNEFMLYAVISADNLAAGLASAAFVAFLSSLTDISFTAVQYAIFTSLMTLFPKVLGGYSGGIVDSIGYDGFFLFTTIIGLPIIFLVQKCGKEFTLKK